MIERTFGIMKQRFKCLQIPLRTDLSYTVPIIVATACLHNFAKRLCDDFNTDDGGFLQQQHEDEHSHLQQKRNVIIERVNTTVPTRISRTGTIVPP